MGNGADHSTVLLDEMLSVLYEKWERGESVTPDELVRLRHGEHVFTTDLLRSALADGFVAEERGCLDLSARGRREAESIIRCARLAERLLVDILRVRDDLVEPSACRLEHSLSQEIADSICTLLGHPKTCPHGHAIPPGDCCRNATTEILPIVRPLASLRPGDVGSVVYVGSRFHDRLTRLVSLGLTPGEVVTVKQVRPSFVVAYGEIELALERDVAAEIYVRVSDNHRER
jgi:DtxR family Mn-dependent transcriptional regulator